MSCADIPASDFVAYTPVSEFVETFRTYNKSSYDYMIEYNLGVAVKEEILLFETATKKYLLDRTFAVLSHAKQFTLSYVNLQYQDVDRKTRTLYSQEEPFKVETIFIPLGWLAEVDKKTSNRRTTHYVVLLDITGKPSSLWIVFDYESLDEFFDLGQNKLNNLGLHNRMTFSQEHRWYETPHTVDGALGTSENALVSDSNGTDPVLHDHVISDGDWEEIKGFDRLAVEDQERQKILSQQGPHKGQEGGGDNKYKDDNKEADSETEEDPWGEEWDAAFNFLGYSEPFDLACMSLDISRWKADTAIDVRHVKHCLKKARHCFGSTLRAKHAARDRDGTHEHVKVLKIPSMFEK